MQYSEHINTDLHCKSWQKFNDVREHGSVYHSSYQDTCCYIEKHNTDGLVHIKASINLLNVQFEISD